MQIIKNAVALIRYTLKDDEGNVIDTSEELKDDEGNVISEGHDPLAYLHGGGAIIPGLESALEGKTAGESIEVRVEPADGYGEKREEMIQTVPRDMMPKDVELEVGMQLQGQTTEGHAQPFVIVGLTNTDVTLDGNHPLAGVALNFAVEVVEVRKASEEELSHGHVHGPGGHEH